MNTTELQKKLMAAARSTAPDDRVPYAFEKRIMALLTSAKPLDVWTLWGHALWRAAVSCVAVTLLTGAWMLWSGPHTKTRGALMQIGIGLFANITRKRYPIDLRRRFVPRAPWLRLLQPAHNARNPYIKSLRNRGYRQSLLLSNG